MSESGPQGFMPMDGAQSMPSVALAVSGDLFGGAERQVLTLAIELRRMGIRPSIICFHDAEFAGQVRAEGLALTIVPRAGPLAMIRELRRQMKIARYDVIHTHGYLPCILHALVAYGQVRTMHGAPEFSGTGVLRRMCLAIYTTFERLAIRLRCAALVYVSDELQDRMGWRAAGISLVIPNGIEVPTPAPLVRHARGDTLEVLIAGRLSSVKGVRYALHAVALLDPECRVNVRILGEGEERAELESLARDLQVFDRVTFHGFQRNIAPWLTAADVVLIPSLHEGLPYILLEALGYGCRVVATRVGGMARYFENSPFVRLVPSTDPQAIADALKLEAVALSSPAQRQLASKYVAERFGARSMAEAYVRIYFSAIRSRDQPRVGGITTQ